MPLSVKPMKGGDASDWAAKVYGGMNEQTSVGVGSNIIKMTPQLGGKRRKSTRASSKRRSVRFSRKGRKSRGTRK
jgi:hypothetical protein